MAKQGIIIGEPDKPKTFSVDSQLDSLKVDIRPTDPLFGVIRIEFNSDLPLSGTDFVLKSTKVATIPHSLGYVPAYFVLARVAVNIGLLSQPTYTLYLPDAIWATSEYIFFVIPTTTALEIWVDRDQKPAGTETSAIGGAVLLRYSIFSRELE